MLVTCLAAPLLAALAALWWASVCRDGVGQVSERKGD